MDRTTPASAADSANTISLNVAVGCQPNTENDIVCLWEPQTSKLTEISTADIPFGAADGNSVRPRRVWALAFHFRTGQLIAAIHDGKAARVGALSFGPVPRGESWFTLPVSQISCLAISRDGVRVAAGFKSTAGQTDSIATWNWQEQKLIDQIDEVTTVTALAFNPAPGGPLAVGQLTGSVTVVDQAGKPSHSFETGASFRSLAFASGGNFLGVAGDRKLVIYSLGRKQAMSFPTQGDAQSLALFPGGTFLIAGVENGGRGMIEVLRMPNPSSVERLQAHDGPITLTAFTPTGDYADHLETTGGQSTADKEYLDAWRRCVIDRVFTAMHREERAARDNSFYTVLRSSLDHASEDSAAQAAWASRSLGRGIKPDNFRKQLSRARRRFAELLVHEIAFTVQLRSAETVEDELVETGLMDAIRDYLPPDWRGWECLKPGRWFSSKSRWPIRALLA